MIINDKSIICLSDSIYGVLTCFQKHILEYNEYKRGSPNVHLRFHKQLEHSSEIPEPSYLLQEHSRTIKNRLRKSKKDS